MVNQKRKPADNKTTGWIVSRLSFSGKSYRQAIHPDVTALAGVALLRRETFDSRIFSCGCDLTCHWDCDNSSSQMMAAEKWRQKSNITI